MTSEPDLTSSPTYGNQRRTSNFFPSADESTFPILPEYAKRHNSSPLIGTYNSKGSNQSSRFFNTTSEPLTPLYPRSASTTSTPYTNGQYGMDIALDLSNNLNGLNLFGGGLSTNNGNGNNTTSNAFGNPIDAFGNSISGNSMVPNTVSTGDIAPSSAYSYGSGPPSSTFNNASGPPSSTFNNAVPPSSTYNSGVPPPNSFYPTSVPPFNSTPVPTFSSNTVPANPFTLPPNPTDSMLNLSTNSGGASSGNVTPAMSSSIWNDGNVGGPVFNKLSTLEELIRQEEDTTKLNGSMVKSVGYGGDKFINEGPKFVNEGPKFINEGPKFVNEKDNFGGSSQIPYSPRFQDDVRFGAPSYSEGIAQFCPSLYQETTYNGHSFEEGIKYGAPIYQEDDAIKYSGQSRTSKFEPERNVNETTNVNETRNLYNDGAGFASRDSFANEAIFSPFSSETTSPTSTRLNIKKANIYLSRVNNPSFVPNSVEESPAIMEKTESEAKVDKMRDFLKKHPGPKTKLAKSQVATPDVTPPALFNLQESLNRIKRLEERSFQKIKESKDDDSETPKVRLRLGSNSSSQTPHKDAFMNEILRHDNHANRYSEDYCSLFYKRNSHGYMFIKEPTNSLKVNATGSKSWVQLKIKLPSTSETDPLVKKLKVDIKELPIWKPINLNGTSAPTSANLKKLSTKYKDRKDRKNVTISKRFVREDSRV